jgi:hypothetical protein
MIPPKRKKLGRRKGLTADERDERRETSVKIETVTLFSRFKGEGLQSYSSQGGSNLSSCHPEDSFAVILESVNFPE